MEVRSDFDDGQARCGWLDGSAVYTAYHDEEWGHPQDDDRALFEQLSLEGFQAGLSWITILRKRPAFRAGFAGFDFEKLARFGPREAAALLADPGIVRHRGKIESVINNARRALELREAEGSLAAFFWRYEPARPAEGLAQATALSKALKKRGWGFVGPTTVYAFMQAVGMVNDHDPRCCGHARCERARQVFRRPV